ncbi:MAG: DUF4430 domain-containing protein [Patescibacteria group bacterium]
MKTKKAIFILLGILILAVVLFSSNQKISNPSGAINSNNPTLKQSSIYLSIDFGGSAQKISQSLDFKNGENLLDAMIQTNLKIETKTYVGLGSIIESINDFKSGAGGKYWQYWVNGKYSQVGASAYKIQPDDLIEWRFTSDNPN